MVNPETERSGSPNRCKQHFLRRSSFSGWADEVRHRSFQSLDDDEETQRRSNVRHQRQILKSRVNMVPPGVVEKKAVLEKHLLQKHQQKRSDEEKSLLERVLSVAAVWDCGHNRVNGDYMDDENFLYPDQSSVVAGQAPSNTKSRASQLSNTKKDEFIWRRCRSTSRRFNALHTENKNESTSLRNEAAAQLQANRKDAPRRRGSSLSSGKKKILGGVSTTTNVPSEEISYKTANYYHQNNNSKPKWTIREKEVESHPGNRRTRSSDESSRRHTVDDNCEEEEEELIISLYSEEDENAEHTYGLRALSSETEDGEDDNKSEGILFISNVDATPPRVVVVKQELPPDEQDNCIRCEDAYCSSCPSEMCFEMPYQVSDSNGNTNNDNRRATKRDLPLPSPPPRSEECDTSMVATVPSISSSSDSSSLSSYSTTKTTVTANGNECGRLVMYVAHALRVLEVLVETTCFLCEELDNGNRKRNANDEEVCHDSIGQNVKNTNKTSNINGYSDQKKSRQKKELKNTSASCKDDDHSNGTNTTHSNSEW